MKLAACAIVACSGLWLVNPVQADSMRCGQRLVMSGSAMYDVRSLCGPPDAIEHRIERRTVKRQVPAICQKPSATPCFAVIDDTIEVPLEVWTYDFGPQRFVQYVVFEQGSVIRFENGGYGHKSS